MVMPPTYGSGTSSGPNRRRPVTPSAQSPGVIGRIEYSEICMIRMPGTPSAASSSKVRSPSRAMGAITSWGSIITGHQMAAA